LLYPLEAMQAAGDVDGTFLRTDSHMTLAGNKVIQRELMKGLGVPCVPDNAFSPTIKYPISGDLGCRFDPNIVELKEVTGHLGAATEIESNAEPFLRKNRHLGRRHVFRNAAAIDPRTVVLFGDSFASAHDHYQGIAWSLAQIFSETHLVWIPFAWDPDYVRRVGAELVVFAAAERFLVVVPEIRVDATEVARRALEGSDADGWDIAQDVAFRTVRSVGRRLRARADRL
jgi:hypothetical protein